MFHVYMNSDLVWGQRQTLKVGDPWFRPYKLCACAKSLKTVTRVQKC